MPSRRLGPARTRVLPGPERVCRRPSDASPWRAGEVPSTPPVGVGMARRIGAGYRIVAIPEPARPARTRMLLRIRTETPVSPGVRRPGALVRVHSRRRGAGTAGVRPPALCAKGAGPPSGGRFTAGPREAPRAARCAGRLDTAQKFITPDHRRAGQSVADSGATALPSGRSRTAYEGGSPAAWRACTPPLPRLPTLAAVLGILRVRWTNSWGAGHGSS